MVPVSHPGDFAQSAPGKLVAAVIEEAADQPRKPSSSSHYESPAVAVKVAMPPAKNYANISPMPTYPRADNLHSVPHSRYRIGRKLRWW